MNTNSWIRLEREDGRHALPDALRERDPMAARDCGWVEQMTPFLRHHASADGWVVDPFCGFGSTLVAASLAGFRAAGVEIDPGRAALAASRLAGRGLAPVDYPVFTGTVADASTRAALHGDGGTAPRRFTLCLTNVPYFGCPPLPETGVADTGQLYGQSWYAHYLQGMRDVFGGVHALLAPSGWCIVMVQNVRVAGTFAPLAWDIARLLGERFVLHEERILLYDKPAPDAAPGDPRTNRAHEYALVCRKAARGVNREAAAAWLAALRADGFEFIVFGSFADALAGTRAVVPDDIDLLVPPREAMVSRLLAVLEAQGFGIESWNAPATPPVSLAALRYRHYFRARRLDAAGNMLQVDIALAADEGAWLDSVARAMGSASLSTVDVR